MDTYCRIAFSLQAAIKCSCRFEVCTRVTPATHLCLCFPTLHVAPQSLGGKTEAFRQEFFGFGFFFSCSLA